MALIRCCRTRPATLSPMEEPADHGLASDSAHIFTDPGTSISYEYARCAATLGQPYPHRRSRGSRSSPRRASSGGLSLLSARAMSFAEVCRQSDSPKQLSSQGSFNFMVPSTPVSSRLLRQVAKKFTFEDDRGPRTTRSCVHFTGSSSDCETSGSTDSGKSPKSVKWQDELIDRKSLHLELPITYDAPIFDRVEASGSTMAAERSSSGLLSRAANFRTPTSSGSASARNGVASLRFDTRPGSWRSNIRASRKT